MNRTKTFLLAGSAVAALVAGGAALATAAGDDDASEQARGPAAEAAVVAALKITGGTANAVERDDENGATWEVEVTKTDGTTVDVRLDEHYDLVVIEGDGESDSE